MKLLTFKVPLTTSVSADNLSTVLTTEVHIKDGKMSQSVRLFYTYSDRPLTLVANDVKSGDEIAVIILPWRIEMWVNGILADEEWPCGDAEFDCVAVTDFSSKGITLTESDENDDNANKAVRSPDFISDCGISANEDSDDIISVLDSVNGENPAEGWKPRDTGVFTGDAMPYKDYDADGTERFHLLYLKDRHHHTSKWHKGAHQWAHMSTTDFKHWDIHPLVVSIDDPTEGSICTGSWLKTESGKHYLYYTIRPVDNSPAPLLRSVSDDGYHYKRDNDFKIILSDKYHGNSARDPKIVKSPDGSYHMFVTTSLMVGEYAGHGCLAHLISPDGIEWSESEPIYISPDGDQPECSDYFAKDGWFYLIFSHRGSGQYLMSRKMFSNWKKPANPNIPCESVPKMAYFNNRIIFTGFNRIDGYAGTLTFKEAYQNEDGTLRF